MKRWIAAGSSLLLILALGYWYFGLGKPGQSPQDASASSAAATTPPPPAQARSPHADVQRQWANLPPAGAPLTLIHDDLQRRADAGDAPAACRLGVELVRCGMLRSLTTDNVLIQAEEELQSIALEEGAEPARQRGTDTLRMIERSRSCAGITDEQLLRANRYLRQAALADIPEAAMRYAEGQGLSMVNVVDSGMFGFLRAPGLDAWRREAVPLVERQLRLGNPAATMTLMSAFNDDNTLFGGLVEKDPEIAYRYLVLFRTVVGSKAPDPRPPLSVQAATRARADVRQMYQ